MSVEGVILAAGLSSRAETYKMTLEIEGKTVIEKCVESMYDVCSRIIVVGGYKYSIISEVLNKYHKVQLVFNSNFLDGMYSSVKCGIENVREERFFIIPGDYPMVMADTYRKMLNEEGDIVIPIYNTRKGHPVLMRSCLTNDLMNNPQFTNLREFINSVGYSTVEVQDPGILTDIDTMEDYVRMFV